MASIGGTGVLHEHTTTQDSSQRPASACLHPSREPSGRAVAESETSAVTANSRPPQFGCNSLVTLPWRSTPLDETDSLSCSNDNGAQSGLRVMSVFGMNCSSSDVFGPSMRHAKMAGLSPPIGASPGELRLWLKLNGLMADDMKSADKRTKAATQRINVQKPAPRRSTTSARRLPPITRQPLAAAPVNVPPPAAMPTKTPKGPPRSPRKRDTQARDARARSASRTAEVPRFASRAAMAETEAAEEAMAAAMARLGEAAEEVEEAEVDVAELEAEAVDVEAEDAPIDMEADVEPEMEAEVVAEAPIGFEMEAPNLNVSDADEAAAFEEDAAEITAEVAAEMAAEEAEARAEAEAEVAAEMAAEMAAEEEEEAAAAANDEEEEDYSAEDYEEESVADLA